MLGAGTRTAVLLHGGGLSWWNHRAVADLLAANGYRVVLPVLDGHAGSDGPFTSIEDIRMRPLKVFAGAGGPLWRDPGRIEQDLRRILAAFEA